MIMPYVNHLVDTVNLSEDLGFFSYECEKRSLDKIKEYVEYGNLKAKFTSALENIFLDIPTDCLNIVTSYVSSFPSKTVSLSGSPLISALPIHSAARAGRIDVVEYLLENSVDIDSINILGETPLYIASALGNTEMVKYLLSRGATDTPDEIICFFEKPVLPLIAAAHNGHLETVIALVNAKIDIHKSHSYTESSTYEYTPALWNAVRRGHSRVVSYLLSKGASTMQYTVNGTSFLAAAENGSVRIMKLLVNARSTRPYALDFMNDNNVCPIICAAYYNNIPLVKFLIEQKALILAANIHGITAYGWACSNDNLPLMKLLEDAGGDDTHLKRWNGLFSAVSSNKIKAVHHIVKRGVSVNISSIQSGNSPLHLAAKYGYTDMIRFLLDNGANPNAANYMKETPLYLAVQSGHLSAVKEILKCPNIYMTRAAVDTGLTAPMVCIQEMYNAIGRRDEDKYMDIFTVLYQRGINTVVRPSTSIFGRMNIIEYSLSMQQYNIFFMLVDSIRYINATSPVHNYTLLHFATFYSAPVAVIEALLNKGANINAVSDTDQTPLYCALYRHNDDVVKLLLDRGANPNILISQVPLLQYTMLHYAKEDTLYDIITYMIEKGADIHMKGETTSLMSAAVIGDVTLIRYCLLRGCDINAQRLDGTTSLMLAASNGHLACVEDLVEAGADCRIKDRNGKTALTLASQHDSIAEYLAKAMGVFQK